LRNGAKTRHRGTRMKVAYLFNSDDPKYRGFYGYPINETVLSKGILQASNRRMRCSIGDVVTFGHVARRASNRSYADLAELEYQVYQTNGWDRRIRTRLERTFAQATVYCLVFQNITEDVADALHVALKNDLSYLGGMAVDFSNALHLVFFRNSLIELCRLEGKKCSIFYNMGENEDPDLALREFFEKYGYTVSYEDSRARRTIFDNYDTLDHFRRVEKFRRLITEIGIAAENRVSDLVLNLEELHPYLFDILFAAVDSLARAETAEQLAHTSLSGRRFLEYFADSLFPPRETMFLGRKGERAVAKANYKNRIWAFVETTMNGVGELDEQKFLRLGTEADRLCDLFNSGLHHHATKNKVATALIDLVSWASEVIEIDPASVRKPYGAYEEEMRKFFIDVVGQRGD
jgi:hypothetical protein